MTPSQQIVADVRNAFGVIRRHGLLIAVVFSVLLVISIIVISRIPRMYQATANVLVVNGNSRNDPTLSSTDLPSIVGSTAVLERVQRKLGITTPLLAMKHSLVAKPPAYRSGIMRIQYTDSNRERAALIVNGIADELASYYTELSTARYDDDLRALDAEISRQKTRLESIDQQMKAQGGEDLTTDDGQDGDSSGSQVSTLKSQRSQAYADLQGDIAHAQAATADDQHDILLSDPAYQELQSNLTKASADLADARLRYTPQYPGLSALKNRVDSLKTALAQESAKALSAAGSASPDELKAQASVEANRAKVTALDEELAAENNKLSAASPLDQLRLERQEVLHEYQSVAVRRATSLADRADALSLGSVEVVDRAIPSEEQTGMGPIRLTLIAALIISIVAFGSAFLADELDPSLRRITQIEGLYGKPLIATIKTTSYPERLTGTPNEQS
jgi:uncharacterized protein involved in exopolysaccharide biosynthesis